MRSDSIVNPLYMKPISQVFLIFALFSINTAYSQNDIIRQQSFIDTNISHVADNIKGDYIKHGFVVVKEASMAMESEYEMPVIFPLTQGAFYQCVFIGDLSSTLYEVRMYDWSEREVVYQKKQWGDVDGNVISYSYIPQFSEYHLMKPLQVNKKKKKLGGYVILFKRLTK